MASKLVEASGIRDPCKRNFDWPTSSSDETGVGMYLLQYKTPSDPNTVRTLTPSAIGHFTFFWCD